MIVLRLIISLRGIKSNNKICLPPRDPRLGCEGGAQMPLRGALLLTEPLAPAPDYSAMAARSAFD